MKEIDETLPEVVKNFLRQGAKLENITLHANGDWTHEGEAIENSRVADAFYRHIDRTQGGTWVIHIPPYTYPIEVEDTGFFVDRVKVENDLLRATLRGGAEDLVNASNITFREPDRLCVKLSNGHEARFLRAPYNTIMERLEKDEQGYYLDFGVMHVVIAQT